LGAYLPRFRALGMHITKTVPADGLAVGTLPIAALPAASQIAAFIKPASSPITAIPGAEPSLTAMLSGGAGSSISRNSQAASFT
jgi:hypothetical protein